MIAAPAVMARWATRDEVPVIDFGPLRDGSDGALDRVATAVHNACRDTGFFTVINHPVPPAAIRAVFDASRRFFVQPLAARMRLHMGESDSFRGYLPMDRYGEDRNFRGKAIPGFQLHLDDDTRTAREARRKHFNNLNDAFQISAELPSDDPDVRAGTPLHGPNLWPDLPDFKEPLLAYYDVMRAFALEVARVFARGLAVEPDHFTRHYRKPLMQLRLLRYLPQPAEAAIQAGEVAAHCDGGGFTLLQQDATGGLEIKTRAGEWVVVPPVENSFVVNIGDSMKLWTNNRFASTPHRVVNRYGSERYSIGFFANPDYDAVITPVPTCVDADNPPRFERLEFGPAMLYLYSRIWPSKKVATPA
jgi:isopenicillin N synthase-like dioxygenase